MPIKISAAPQFQRRHWAWYLFIVIYFWGKKWLQQQKANEKKILHFCPIKLHQIGKETLISF